MNDALSNPLVTVLLASYNHEPYISDSILSVIHQTYKNIQLIVIDDGSTDHSAALIQLLAGQHGFRFISQTNSGLPTVLNRGIELAEGKYFIAFSSDDIMMLDRIEKQVRLMETHPHYAVSAGNVIKINTDGLPLAKQRFHAGFDMDFDDVFTHRKGNILAPTAMMRTDVLRQAGCYDPAIRLEDLYMWLKITSLGYPVHIMPDILAYWRNHTTNVSIDVLFMARAFVAIYAPYRDRPDHDKMLYRLLINQYLKACRGGYQNGFTILAMVPVRYYNFKVVSGLFRWLFRKLARR
jgi:alpha-1,3-rhamnosyltransferase